MNDILSVLNKNTISIIMLLSKGDFYLRELSDSLKVSPSAVHSALKALLDFNFVRVVKQKNKKNYSLNRENALLKNIKRLLNIALLLKLEDIKKLQKYGAVGIYGSFANGTDSADSDIDMWIFSEKKIAMLKIRKTIRSMEKRLGRHISLTILDPIKLKKLRTEDLEFYYRLKLTSIPLGELPFD